MNTRSTGTHFGADVVSNHDQDHGVKLSGGSTGGRVDAIGDDSNITLSVAGKGTGQTRLGNSSSPVVIGSSGSAVGEILSAVIQFTPPLLSSGAAAATESTHTFTGCSTGTVLTFTPANAINSRYVYRARCSTVNELIIVWGMVEGSSVGSGESTNHGRVLQFRF